MTHFVDSLSGTLDVGGGNASEDDVAVINGLSNPPPVKVTIDDIHVRSCRLAGDGINCHFGRFHTEDLPGLLEKIQGVSCLIGHRKETVGIARFFGGSIEKRVAADPETASMKEMNFIVPKIYWMKSHSQAEDLRINIDGGIYHQASISWYFEKPVCGICGKDIRSCDHMPGKKYNGNLCFFWYEDIKEVLEGSIVYAGGHPGTGFALNNAGTAAHYKNQETVFKIKPDGRLHKEDIVPYFQNIESGSIYITGDLAMQGWTDKDIEIFPDSEVSPLVGEILPAYLAERITVHDSFPAPGACIKISSNSTLEIESIPGVSQLEEGRRPVIEKQDPSPLENDRPVNYSVLYPDSAIKKKPVEKIFDIMQFSGMNEPFIMTPHYEGIPVKLEIGTKSGEKNHIESGTDSCRIIRFELSPETSSLEYLLKPSLQKIAADAVRWNCISCEITGELLLYKGHSRIDHATLNRKEKTRKENMRIVMKVIDFRDEKTKDSEFLLERLERFAELCGNSDAVQCIPFRSSLEPNRLKNKLDAVMTRTGVAIIPMETPFDEHSNKRILSTKFVLDVEVLDAIRKHNGWVYQAGIRDNNELIHIGATHISALTCPVNDVIRVELDSMEYRDRKISWKNPRVISLRSESLSDSLASVKNLHDALNNKSRLSGKTSNSMMSDNGNDTGNGLQISLLPERSEKSLIDLLVINIHHVDMSIDGEAFCMRKDDLEKLDRGYMCPGYWQSSDPDDGSKPDQSEIRNQLNTDNGSMTILEWGKFSRTGAFAGKTLNGIYRFRQLTNGGDSRWYIEKRQRN